MKCSICLLNISDGFALACAHTFHKDCIKTCIEYKHTKCPLCLSHISKDIQIELCPELKIEQVPETENWFLRKHILSDRRRKRIRECLREGHRSREGRVLLRGYEKLQKGDPDDLLHFITQL